MVVLGEKLRWVLWATQPVGLRAGVVSSCICPTLLMTYEMLPYIDCVRYVWSRAIRGPSMESVWHVDKVSPIGCMLVLIKH
jgi:hypothetical protein